MPPLEQFLLSDTSSATVFYIQYMHAISSPVVAGKKAHSRQAVTECRSRDVMDKNNNNCTRNDFSVYLWWVW